MPHYLVDKDFFKRMVVISFRSSKEKKAAVTAVNDFCECDEEKKTECLITLIYRIYQWKRRHPRSYSKFEYRGELWDEIVDKINPTDILNYFIKEDGQDINKFLEDEAAFERFKETATKSSSPGSKYYRQALPAIEEYISNKEEAERLVAAIYKLYRWYKNGKGDAKKCLQPSTRRDLCNEIKSLLVSNKDNVLNYLKAGVE